MKPILLKNYQEDAVSELQAKTIKQFERSGNRTIVFKSPTGSGKTLMMAEYLKRLVDIKPYNFSFIWAAPRQLHKQSKESLKKYFHDTQSLKTSFFSDLLDNKIKANEILFLNWESINKENNIVIRENERDFYLDKVLENTKEEGRELILIIDESHFSVDTDISSNLIKDISPKITIEVSATPSLENEHASVIVDIDDVKEEGMIKKSIVFQDGYDNEISNDQLITIREKGTNILVLEDALKKRSKLQTLYKKIGKSINPLVLIQLPDRKTKEEDALMIEIIEYLKTRSITTDNNKLAIYLSEQKENLVNISKNSHESQVLIFKQAIALGWDCPRADILVLFRNWRSVDFSIQTVGRILRMPEPEEGHYKYDELNHAYFFTNLDNITLNDNQAKSYLSIKKSIRKKKTNLATESCHRIRQREKTRLDPSFVNLFLESAKNYNLKKKLNLSENKISQSIFSKQEYESLNDLQKDKIEQKIEYRLENVEEIQKLFDIFSVKLLSPEYSPEERSLKRLNYSIYKFFENELEIDFSQNLSKIIEIVLDKRNSKHFFNVVDNAKLKYKNLQAKKSSKLSINKNWDIPEKLLYSTDVKEMHCNKSIMNPFLYSSLSKPEIAFIKYLEDSEEVLWWFRNGDRDDTFFALPYKKDNEEHPFYVDFIIKFKDEKLGFFDTKDGITITEAFASGKAEGLHEYLKKNKNFVGGIITNTDKDNAGVWKCFTREVEEYKEGNYENWEHINF